MADWFFTSDLHGQTDFYEQILALAAEGQPRVVMIGGDLCPHAIGEAGLLRQRLFLEGVLVEFARRLKERVPGGDLLLLMGNDDWCANLPVLERHEGELWRVLHDRHVEIDGVPVAGSPWVPITPFAMKDWERWEDGEAETPAQLKGWSSRSGAMRECVFDPARREPTIADALEVLAALSRPAETIYALHSPPRETRCDMMAGGRHVGSRAIRRWLERHQPPLVLSGHIHESPRVSGAWRDRLERSIVVNPGQFGSPKLCGVWFDPGNIDATLRHTVHG